MRILTAILVLNLIIPLVFAGDIGTPVTYFGTVTIDGVLQNSSVPVKFYLGDDLKVVAYVGNGDTSGLYFADFAKKVSDPMAFKATIYGITAATGTFSQGVHELDLSINKVLTNGGCTENQACISGVCCKGICKTDCFVPRRDDDRERIINNVQEEQDAELENPVERPAAIDQQNIMSMLAQEKGVESKAESVFSDQSIAGLAVGPSIDAVSSETVQKSATPVVASVSFALAALAVAAFLVFRKG